MEHINRFGEVNPHPGKGRSPYLSLAEDEYGLTRVEDENDDPDWSHDPRSTAAHEKHIIPQTPVSDAKIKQRVEIALYLNPEINSETIEVSVDAGVVSLRGFVKNRNQKNTIERCIEYLSGVEDILNYLEFF